MTFNFTPAQLVHTQSIPSQDTPVYLATGPVSQYALPSASAVAYGITSGPDGALWFSEQASGAGKVGRIATDGTIVEYPLANYAPGNVAVLPTWIAPGPNNTLWYTTNLGVGYMGTSGDSGTNIVIPGFGQAQSITMARDGNFYIPTSGPDQLIQVKPNGTYSTMRNWGTQNVVQPRRTINGPDTNLWFLEYGTNKVARLSLAGLSEWPIPVLGNPTEIAVGPDGNIWFSEVTFTGTQYLSIAMDGTFGGPWALPQGCCAPILGTTGGILGIGAQSVVQFPTPIGTIVGFPESQTFTIKQMVIGPDGNIWATDNYNPQNNTIDRWKRRPRFEPQAAPEI